MLEIILFAIAVFLVGKLLSVLSITNEDEAFYQGSIFGKQSKDVTNSGGKKC